MNPSKIPAVARIVVAYAVVGCLWIVLSDLAAHRLAVDPAVHAHVSVYKGLAFVLVTALLLAYALKRELDVRQRDQAALRDSEARYRQLFDANPQPMWLYDLATLRFLAVNDAAIAAYGWSRDEFMAMTIADIRPSDAVEQLRKSLARITATEFTSLGVFAHRKRDGTMIDAEIMRRSIEFRGREAALVLARDVTERERNERTVRESERLKRATLDALPAAIAILDAGGRVVAVNRAWRVSAERRLEPPAACGGEGTNYLELCDRAAGDSGASAHALAGAIRQAAAGELAEREIEFQCHPAGEERWLVARIVRFGDERSVHVVVALLDVTERRQAEAALRRQDELLNEYVAANPCIVYALTVDNGRVVPEWVSANIQTVLGYSSREASAPDWWLRQVHPTDRASAKAVHEKARDSGRAEGEYRIRRADGSWAWVHDQLRCQSDRQGRPMRLIGACADITELQRARSALLASEKRLRATFQHAAVGVAHVAPDGEWLEVNPKLCEIVGYTRAELLGRCCRDITHPEDLPADREEQHRLLTGEVTSASREKRYLHKRGDVVWVNHTASVVLTQGGAPAYFVVIVEDITESKRIGEELLKLSRAVEQSFESVMITDLQARIEYVNDALVRVSGYARDELIGRNPRILQSGQTPRSTYLAMWAALARGRPWQGELCNRRKDGSIYVESAIISPIRQPDGRITHYVAVKEDITASRRTAAELDRYRHRLEELVAERTVELDDARRQAEAANQAKSAFLANMSHEIRTPMNGVLGMLEVLARGRLSEQQAEMVSTAQESGRTLLGIIDDILDFSKIEAGRMEIECTPLSVLDVVEGLCESMVPLAVRRDVDLSVFVAPEIPSSVSCDPLRLRQILFNLIGNAIKFSSGRDGRRGRVAVRATVAQQEPLRLAFAVGDNGIGMTSETIARLFVPFSQAEASTTRRYGGTGLGLTICKRLADLMGGEISVASGPEEGSTFTLTLAVQPVADRRGPALPDLSGVECLIVESTDLDIDAMCCYLEHAGARVRRTASDDAAAAMAASHPGPMVVIRDAGDQRPPYAGMAAFQDLRRVRQVWITRGRRRRSRVDAPAVVTVDGAALRRQALLDAVAVAAGRASPAVAPDDTLAAQTAGAPAPPSIDEARERGELILVAEDDEISAKVLRKQLDLLGRTAQFAPDGAAALRLWDSGQHALVLTDLHMPVLDGYGLAASIRSAEAAHASPARRTPIVALTANALRGEAERTKAVGFDDYLTKPLQLERLREALERWLCPAGPAAPTAPAAPREACDRVAIDIAVLRSHIGADPQAERQLLADFLESAKKQRAELRSAAEDNAPQRAAAVAHKLKSAARAVGAAALGELCAAIEQAGKGGDCRAVAARMAPLDAALARVETDIAALVAVEDQ